MSQKMSTAYDLQELRVDKLDKPRLKPSLMMETGRGQREPDYVYVNPGFVGSTGNVRRQEQRLPEGPPTSVVREQYWACSRWTSGQRYMAIAVAVLLGTVIGLAITIVLNGGDTDLVAGIFRSRTAPD